MIPLPTKPTPTDTLFPYTTLFRSHPRYLEGAMLTLEINPVTELLESCTQIGMIDRADDTVVAPQLVPMERLPFAVGHAGQIGNDGVDMSLRIEGPARVVLE